MLGLRLEIDTDEPHDLNVRKRVRLPRDSWETARKKAFKYALRAVENYCDTSDVHAIDTERAENPQPNPWENPPGWPKPAPSADFPWVIVADQQVLQQLQENGQAPPGITIDQHTVRVAFAGRCGDDDWDGWLLQQTKNGNVHGEANHCHVLSLSVEIAEM